MTAKRLASKIQPSGAAPEGSFTSSPVENTAALSRFLTASVPLPSEAKRPISWARSRWPRLSTTAPFFTSSPAMR